MTNEKIKKAKQYFYQKKYQEALDIFSQDKNCFYESGLCSLLLKNEKSAFEFWNKNKKQCPACEFGLNILNFIKLKPSKTPSFFQTRAQLEIFLNLFLENNMIDWAQNLISNCDALYQANPESYKFIARALFSNGYFDLSIYFCKKSIKLHYCDPEAFLILSQCEFLLGNLGEALDAINRINRMVSDYFPAKIFKIIITEEIKKKNN